MYVVKLLHINDTLPIKKKGQGYECHPFKF